MSAFPTVCISPLNWGLGHAGRCVPIIRELLEKQCYVILCGNGESLDLLQREFPDLPTERLPDFQIYYARNAWLTQISIMAQTPVFMHRIRYDAHVTAQIVEKYRPHVLISDNRYGFWHPDVYSILITHQLRPQLPVYLKFLSNPFYAIIDRWMSRFNEIWIPDVKGNPNLSGKLSHVCVFNEKIRYIGILSRFHLSQSNQNTAQTIVALASGPEPARSQFIKLAFHIAHHSSFPMILVVPPSVNLQPSIRQAFADIIQTSNTTVLQQILEQAMCILCRSAYTTMMDLVRLNKKALLLPTPGQTEQLYLAKHNAKYHLFEILDKPEKFNEAMQKLLQKQQSNDFIRNDDAMLKEVIHNTLQIIKHKKFSS